MYDIVLSKDIISALALELYDVIVMDIKKEETKEDYDNGESKNHKEVA